LQDPVKTLQGKAHQIDVDGSTVNELILSLLLELIYALCC